MLLTTFFRLLLGSYFFFAWFVVDVSILCICFSFGENWTLFDICEFGAGFYLIDKSRNEVEQPTKHFMVKMLRKIPWWSKPWPSNVWQRFISKLTQNRSYWKWTISWKSQTLRCSFFPIEIVKFAILFMTWSRISFFCCCLLRFVWTVFFLISHFQVYVRVCVCYGQPRLKTLL